MAEVARITRATASCISRELMNLYSAIWPLKHVYALWR